MQPGNLMLLRGPKLGRVEYLIALGWAGIHHRTASTMYRMVHGMDAAHYPDTLKTVERLVSHLATKRKWTVKPHNFPRVAKNALDFVLNPHCPCCHGRGYEVVEGTNRLSERMCCHCNGTGRRRVDTRHLSEVICELERFEDVITRDVCETLRG